MKYQWIILALALGAGLFASLVVDKRDNANFEPDYPISLLETKDKAVDLYRTDDPRIRVIYFGYTHCPDVCPTSLAVMSAALQQLEPAQLDRLWPIFITLDPARDTPEKSAEYAQYFHKTIIGMTGTQKQTQALAEKYGVLYMKTELKDSALEYAVDHNSYFYFLAPDGTLLEKVQHTLNPNRLVETINTVLDAPAS